MISEWPSGGLVVGVDGSHPAQLALRWALAEAALRDWPVQIVHAWTVGGVQHFAWTSRQWLRTDSQALLRTALAAARQHTDATVGVDCRSVEGHPAFVLAAAAREASLLVLGARPRRDPTRLGALGSCCARLLTIPIAVITSPEATLTIHNGLRVSTSG